MAMQPSVAAQHSTLSYSKWDMLEDSDDEPDGKSKPLQPLLSGNKTFSQRDADEKAAQRFVKHIKDHLPATKPAHRELVSRYVAACSKGKQQTNIYRYSDICSFVTRYKAELLPLAMIDSMCELHKALVNAAHENADRKDALTADAEILMDAINALEACRRYDNACDFFECVSSPSRSEKARSAAEAYVKREFGKRAMLRWMFKEEENIDEDAEDLDHFLSEKQKPPPPPPQRLLPWLDPELFWLLAAAVAFFAMIAGGGIFLYYQLAEAPDGSPPSTPPEVPQPSGSARGGAGGWTAEDEANDLAAS